MTFSRSRVAALAAVTAASYLTLVKLVAVPLHERGVAQELLSRACGLGHLLEVPVRGFAHITVLRGAPEELEVVTWWCCLALNTAICFTLALVLQTLVRRSGTAPTIPVAIEKAEKAERTQSRRGFIRWGLSGTAGAGAAVFSYGFVVETRRLQVSRRSISIRDLPPSLDGLRIAQITDVHLGPWITLAFRSSTTSANSSRSIACYSNLGASVTTGDGLSPFRDFRAGSLPEGLPERHAITLEGMLNSCWMKAGDSVEPGDLAFISKPKVDGVISRWRHPRLQA